MSAGSIRTADRMAKRYETGELKHMTLADLHATIGDKSQDAHDHFYVQEKRVSRVVGSGSPLQDLMLDCVARATLPAPRHHDPVVGAESDADWQETERLIGEEQVAYGKHRNAKLFRERLAKIKARARAQAGDDRRNERSA